jgi:thiamine pyrophosphate-dependent acetolactate synthase large subunit-like protein
VILENGAFLETGGQPIATHGSADLVGLARSAGIRQAARAADPVAFTELLEYSMAQPGPSLVVARVERDSVRDLPPVDPVRVKLRFMDALAQA